MNDWLPPWPALTAFVAASVVLAVTPGPGVFYIVTRSLAQGRRAGLASVAGVAAGNFGNAVGASVGLAALFAVSSSAFLVVKYLGALYLVYLGVRVLSDSPPRFDEVRVEPVELGRLFRDGLVVALLNPKTAVFFAAFLPQFLGSDTAPVQQSILLGALFVLIAAGSDTLYAVTAGAIAPTLRRSRGMCVFGRYATGAALVGLGAWTALTGSRRRG